MVTSTIRLRVSHETSARLVRDSHDIHANCTVIVTTTFLWTFLTNQLVKEFWKSVDTSLPKLLSNIKGVKEVDLYSAFIVVPHTQGTQVRITQFYLQTPYLPIPRKRSPDGTSPDWGCTHLIEVYCSFIYPEMMKRWVGLVGWPTADGLLT